MARKNKTQQEVSYLRNYWDEVGEMEADYKGVVLMSIERSPRPGVVKIRLSFTPLLGNVENGMGSSMYQAEFPDAYNTTFAGALWSASLKLLALVETNASAHKRSQAS